MLVLIGFHPRDLAEKLARVEEIVACIGVESGLPLRIRIGAAFFPDDGGDAEDLLAIAGQRLSTAAAATVRP
jgi:hypothetical protein